MFQLFHVQISSNLTPRYEKIYPQTTANKNFLLTSIIAAAFRIILLWILPGTSWKTVFMTFLTDRPNLALFVYLFMCPFVLDKCGSNKFGMTIAINFSPLLEVMVVDYSMYTLKNLLHDFAHE